MVEGGGGLKKIRKKQQPISLQLVDKGLTFGSQPKAKLPIQGLSDWIWIGVTVIKPIIKQLLCDWCVKTDCGWQFFYATFAQNC